MKNRMADNNLFYMDWKTASQKISQCEGVVLTFGSIEEHGYHLPMGTDSILTEAFVEKLCEDNNLCYYPPITFGQVWSAKEYEGTISISLDTLGKYGIQAVKSLHRAAPKRIFLFSFHNGNHRVLDDVIRVLYDEMPEWAVFHVAIRGIEGKAKEILDAPMWNGTVWHAGELETSLMLHVEGGLVQMEKATNEFPKIPPNYKTKALPWRGFLESGAFGAAQEATKEKGERLFEMMYEELQKQIQEILER